MHVEKKSPSGKSDGHCEPLVHIPTKLNLHLGPAANCGSSVWFETQMNHSKEDAGKTP